MSPYNFCRIQKPPQDDCFHGVPSVQWRSRAVVPAQKEQEKRIDEADEERKG